MALRRCRECTTRFAVGLPACPHCHSTDHEEDGTMPKITRHGGPTIAGASVVAGGWSDEDEPDVWPDLSADEDEAEQPSAGSGGETAPDESKAPKAASAPVRQRRPRSRS